MRSAVLLIAVLSGGCANMSDEQRERMQRAGAAMQGAGQAMQGTSPSQRTVNCTTYDHGVVVQTTCTEQQ